MLICTRYILMKDGYRQNTNNFDFCGGADEPQGVHFFLREVHLLLKLESFAIKNETSFMDVSFFMQWRQKRLELKIGTVRWTVPAASANTGCIVYFRRRRKCSRVSSGPFRHRGGIFSPKAKMQPSRFRPTAILTGFRRTFSCVVHSRMVQQIMI